MSVNIMKVWENAPKSLAGILELTNSTWNLLAFYVVPETVAWFGSAGRLIRDNREAKTVEDYDIKTVVSIINFPIDPKLPEHLPYLADIQFVSQLLLQRGIIKESIEFRDEAYRCLLRLGGRCVELVLLSSDRYARYQASDLIYNRHILRQCDDYPYPLNIFIC